ncbi:concanavalin A-like lectin/glucanase domain-containing protein [Phakopsora pachyrhizi]|nr:concanavalin A-like lectin/glucanase domain-containing protein [Phakopsora pachyrhizi]
MSSKVQSELNHLKTSTGRILNFSKTRISSRNLLIILSLLTLTSNLSSVKSSADAHRRDDFSFRGPVPEDLHIPHWDISGTTHRIPTAKDFIRLVNPFPLAYGGMFTERTIPFDQWSVEIAFRIHGGYSTVHHGHRNTSHQDAVEDDEHLGKGGRGIAFWYTKSSNPTPVISPSNPHHHRFQPPSLVVDPFPDPLDEKVSFFGGPISFDGVAVVIDNQPSTPLTRRSDRKHWGHEDGGTGAEEWAVVSGVMDDGKGKSKWLEDRSFSEMDEDEEAAYLNHTIGDCQVALRNAPGMVWMKVTHIEGHLRVYLDLLPHTTLSGEERHYTRECFSANNVKLPKNYHIGLTGLSSPNEESDNIDVYAIEVKEIKGHVNKEEEIIEHYKEEHVAADDVKLEGT